MAIRVTKPYDHYKSVPELAGEPRQKKKKPKLIAVVDEDNCTGCQVCIPFCPVACIEALSHEKYGIPIPPVQVRFDECIGCQICARVCTKLTWDAIRMLPTAEFEAVYEIPIS
ncbi:MAG: 4Fe-4S binding protein [Candidatus Marinimicrobia bacterium]|jgi:electron transport complex protein RnfB|nr:4Fe-4S binding protein [Candidatus Neomarinimicrobiota bacterium]MDP6594048.1 4Fe-4S binding protein [Candidatus Neomarinimicrobiota bacterium]MDP6836563.1 4Fe-4S binding protein [Candidatus Neomarinimicrobiota bacterium]MDP6965802.1 4Fe-4S binding protein [Candidatus Neomarinimicrobiota bacterium]|tara:strand:+ start:5375 stop:5713 length:339 start_codon:yes stop_codon:yes gene_type:complete